MSPMLFRRFLAYSFLGFLLEVAYARITRSEKRDRKCFFLLPLCPVYGLGAVLILALHGLWGLTPVHVAAIGFLSATAAEYLCALFYEGILGVRFWDYSALPFNIEGRVCLLFSLGWSVLALALVYFIAPAADPLLAALPDSLYAPAFILFACDAAVSVYALKKEGTTEVLRWYR